jgi:DNA invertase Pin-like site-specific DNA recombinase
MYMQDPATPIRAALYLRQSLDKEGRELAIERQQAECQRLADARVYNVTEVIKDNNRSASEGERPGYQRLLDLIKSKKVDVVIVLRIDRLLRRPIELEWLIKLCEETGASVVSVDGMVDLTNPGGRQVARLQAAFARWEVEIKGERQRLANRQRAAAGQPHGSRRPYGYTDNQMFLEPSEAKVLREMAKRVINGQSFKEIAWWANEQGYRTTTGKLFYPITIRNMLQKPRYAGLREYDGTTYQGQWEPVFDLVTWDKLQPAMRMKRELTKRGLEPRKFLLTGLVVCGKCGTPMNGTTKQDHPGLPKRRVYICRTQGDAKREYGCGGVRRNADALEHWIKEVVLYRLDSPTLRDLLKAGEDDAELRAALEARDKQRKVIEMLDDMLAVGEMDRDGYQHASATARARMQMLDKRVDELHHARHAVGLPAGQSVRDAWDNAVDDDWRRSLLRILIAEIRLHPGATKPIYKAGERTYRFDPSLVEVVWKA